MKHAELRAIVHNVADSLASGVGLLIGYYAMDVFGEAARSEEGAMTVDLLTAGVTEGDASESLRNAILLYREALPKLCEKAGGSVADLRHASVRFWSDAIGPRFAVTIEDARGKRSTAEYVGVPGKRLKLADDFERDRPQPSIA